MQVHERLCVPRLLPALPPVAGVDEGARKGDAKVNVVGATGPLVWYKNKSIVIYFLYGELFVAPDNEIRVSSELLQKCPFGWVKTLDFPFKKEDHNIQPGTLETREIVSGRRFEIAKLKGRTGGGK